MTMRRPNAWRDEEGQTMAEYGVILAVITPAIVAVIALLAMAMADNIGALADFLS
jgi:Flp pilus assembly pilin Flp